MPPAAQESRQSQRGSSLTLGKEMKAFLVELTKHKFVKVVFAIALGTAAAWVGILSPAILVVLGLDQAKAKLIGVHLVDYVVFGVLWMIVGLCIAGGLRAVFLAAKSRIGASPKAHPSLRQEPPLLPASDRWQSDNERAGK